MIDRPALAPEFLSLFAAGIGCRKGISGDEIIALITATLVDAGVSPEHLGLIATLDSKVNEPGIVVAAAYFDVPLRGIAREAMSGHDLPSPSATVFSAIGIAGVAEAAAMALGPLVLPKRKSTGATCAVSRLAPSILPLSLLAEPATL